MGGEEADRIGQGLRVVGSGIKKSMLRGGSLYRRGSLDRGEFNQYGVWHPGPGSATISLGDTEQAFLPSHTSGSPCVK